MLRKEKEKMVNKIEIKISTELYKELETYAKKEDLTVEEFIDKLLADCLRAEADWISPQTSA
jgi:hypothetical protein